MIHSRVSTGCVFVPDYLHERRKPAGSVVVGGSAVIPTRICPVDFGQRESQQGKLRHQIPLRPLEPSQLTSPMPGGNRSAALPRRRGGGGQLGLTS